MTRTLKISKNILKVNELEEEKLQGDSNFKNMVKEVDLLRMKIDQWKEYKEKRLKLWLSVKSIKPGIIDENGLSIDNRME